VRIATWNVNSLNARLERVEEWIEIAQPDVLCLQETKLSDDQFPALAFQSWGYDTVHHGSGQWNGVAIASRVGLIDPVAGFADGIEPDPDTRLVTATCGEVRVTSVYVPNGREVGHDHYHYKLSWLERLREHVDRTSRPSDDVAVLGDFNIAPADNDVWDIAKFTESTHVTPEERSRLAGLLDWGLVDVFREHYPEDGLFSYWDYRGGAFHKREGMRIDLILTSVSLAAKVGWTLVDRNARKGKQPSDHTPVFIDVDE
jgi:exodeoxyribonuclease-3